MKTVSLETAKLLKEAGFPQESYFWWEEKHVGSKEKPKKIWVILNGREVDAFKVVYAAPTAEEILDLLPHVVEMQGKKELLEFRKFIDGYSMNYNYWNNEIFGNSLVEVAAKMWLYIKKENLL